MLGKAWGCTLTGLDAVPVRVECDVGAGLPGVQMVGLAGASVKEATARVRSALRNSGLDFPVRRITINLAPADLHKASPGLDLPVAAAVLAASGQLGRRDLEGWFLVGELGLDGQVRPVAGILPMAILAARQGKGLVAPAACAAGAAVVDGLEVRSVDRLADLVAWSHGRRELSRPEREPGAVPLPEGPDLADVRGHDLPKRALVCAAAGGHHLLLVGPPGAGKTMLASCLRGLLPPLGREESLEVSRIWSVAGLLGGGEGLIRHPPWRAPHPHLGRAAMVGGGRHPVRPGEASLAHLGVLFLDELNRFPGPVLDSLRGPLEEGRVTLGRLGEGVTYPARFLLVGTMNPCQCGRLGDPEFSCTCTGQDVRRYWDCLSGPLLDRIDLQVEVRRLPWEEWKDAPGGPPSEQVRALVAEARQRQAHRLRPVGKRVNAEMGPREVRTFCPLEPEAEQVLAEGFRRLGLSGRGYHRLLKVARTLADLDGRTRVGVEHVAQALQFRQPPFAPVPR